MSLSAQTALISLKIVANIPTHSPKIEIKKIDKNLGITLLFFTINLEITVIFLYALVYREQQ
jgi:hypothetical protein